MPKLMHIACSPRAESFSAEGARVFLSRFRAARPSWDIDELDLWRDGLPELNQAMIDAKDAVQQNRAFTETQREAWAVIERMVVRLSLAERVLISTPMWNFGLPYKLKHYIDLINQPRLTFRFDPATGFTPLLKNRPTVAILASGGDFVTGMNRGRIDMATPYLREALRFMGIGQVEFVRIGPTTGPRGGIDDARQRAHRHLEEVAARF